MTNVLKISITMTLTTLVPFMANAGDERRKITQSCEEALALSALPARLREGASVYSLTESGFELTKKGDGPFTCIVERNHEDAIIPQCADAAGADTVIPGIIMKTEWVLAGVPAAERKERFAKLAEKGDMRAPDRPGINYMMSAFNHIWNAQSGNMMRIPPHVMYYAPNLSNDDVGGSRQEAMGGNRGTPFIIEQGIHGYMTSFVEKASDSGDVLNACEGQLSADLVASTGEQS